MIIESGDNFTTRVRGIRPQSLLKEMIKKSFSNRRLQLAIVVLSIAFLFWWLQYLSSFDASDAIGYVEAVLTLFPSMVLEFFYQLQPGTVMMLGAILTVFWKMLPCVIVPCLMLYIVFKFSSSEDDRI